MVEQVIPDAGKLVELAGRCKVATCPDRELACAIAKAIGWRPRDGEPGSMTSSPWAWCPDFTASIDAAMTLVPTDGSATMVEASWSWEPKDAAVYPAAVLRWYPPYHSGPNWHAEIATAATMPLTICVAALNMRARAACPDTAKSEGEV